MHDDECRGVRAPRARAPCARDALPLVAYRQVSRLAMAMATLSPSATMDEIKWVFDMCGFVLFPSVLDEATTAAMIAQVEEDLAYRQAAGGGLPDGLHMAPGVERTGNTPCAPQRT